MSATATVCMPLVDWQALDKRAREAEESARLAWIAAKGPGDEQYRVWWSQRSKAITQLALMDDDPMPTEEMVRDIIAGSRHEMAAFPVVMELTREDWFRRSKVRWERFVAGEPWQKPSVGVRLRP